MPDAVAVTQKHVDRVKELLAQASGELLRRGEVHDRSKFEPVEMEPLQRLQALVKAEGQAPFGSDEYKRRTALLGPMLAHHYANNSHHPEHYPNGVNGMDLFDLVEMFFDWKAASERGNEGAMSINAACERFSINDQLREIMQNTAVRLGFKHQ